MDIPNILNFKYPGTTWGVGETYESLEWREENTISKPSYEDLVQAEIEYKSYRAKQEHNAPILAQLEVIDLKSIRALREGNQTRIDDLEAEAAELRAQLEK